MQAPEAGPLLQTPVTRPHRAENDITEPCSIKHRSTLSFENQGWNSQVVNLSFVGRGGGRNSAKHHPRSGERAIPQTQGSIKLEAVKKLATKNKIKDKLGIRRHIYIGDGVKRVN